MTPYQLLKKSAPRPMAQPSAYDAYSLMIRDGGKPDCNDTYPGDEIEKKDGVQDNRQSYTRENKTHYISGIQQRHKKALGAATMLPLERDRG